MLCVALGDCLQTRKSDVSYTPCFGLPQLNQGMHATRAPHGAPCTRHGGVKCKAMHNSKGCNEREPCNAIYFKVIVNHFHMRCSSSGYVLEVLQTSGIRKKCGTVLCAQGSFLFSIILSICLFDDYSIPYPCYRLNVGQVEHDSGVKKEPK
jgi:hypothetical protein